MISSTAKSGSSALKCDNHNDGCRGTSDYPFSDSDANFLLASDDSMSSEDDDNQNDFILDDIF
jgi:hypothetical protein